MICWFCGKVKGKRSCPAHGGDGICSRCCGTKRRVEIACPPDCPYLHGEHDARWEPTNRRDEEARFLGHFAGTTRDQVPLLILIHHLLLQVTRGSPTGIPDAELLEIVSTLSRTFETLSKGVVYEHQSQSPHLQSLIDRLGRILSGRDKIPGVPPASDAQLAAVLRAVAAAVHAHLDTSGDSRGYLDLAERVFRPGLEQLADLELPGESSAGPLIAPP